ncbi:MAG: alpha/beta fold hydrolase [Phycisphaerae bacterium]|nr:alpha/beta fold hydrolase [Phycisphaerales bacterium]
MTRRMTTLGLLGFITLSSCAIQSQAEAPDDLQKSKAEFKTDDGVTIVGDYFPPTGRAISPAAILLHMYNHDRSTWTPLIKPLHEAGFAVLAIDLRGHGESIEPADMKLVDRVQERDPKLFNDMHKDAQAAIKWVRTQPNVDQERLVLIGASVGCSVSIDTMAREPSVDAIVCMTPGTNYLGVDSAEQILKTGDRPILLLATEDEREATDALAKAADNATGEIVGSGRVHGTNMLGKIDGIEAKITAFVRDAVHNPKGN